MRSTVKNSLFRFNLFRTLVFLPMDIFLNFHNAVWKKCKIFVVCPTVVTGLCKTLLFINRIKINRSCQIDICHPYNGLISIHFTFGITDYQFHYRTFFFFETRRDTKQPHLLTTHDINYSNNAYSAEEFRTRRNPYVD